MPVTLKFLVKYFAAGDLEVPCQVFRTVFANAALKQSYAQLSFGNLASGI